MNNQMDNRPDRNRPNRNNPGNQGPPVCSGFFDLSADFTGMPELCNRHDE